MPAAARYATRPRDVRGSRDALEVPDDPCKERAFTRSGSTYNGNEHAWQRIERHLTKNRVPSGLPSERRVAQTHRASRKRARRAVRGLRQSEKGVESLEGELSGDEARYEIG